ncbi:hypothetical protein DHODJN_00115 [Methylorubrum extorquens]
MRRSSLGGVLAFGRQASINGSNSPHCASDSITSPHLKPRKRQHRQSVQATTGPSFRPLMRCPYKCMSVCRKKPLWTDFQPPFPLSATACPNGQAETCSGGMLWSRLAQRPACARCYPETRLGLFTAYEWGAKGCHQPAQLLETSLRFGPRPEPAARVRPVRIQRGHNDKPAVWLLDNAVGHRPRHCLGYSRVRTLLATLTLQGPILVTAPVRRSLDSQVTSPTTAPRAPLGAAALIIYAV